MPQVKRFNFFLLFMFLAAVVITVVGIKFLVEYVTAALTIFLVKTVEIGDLYLEKLIGIFYFICASILLLFVFIIDGEQKRIQRAMKRYLSKLVVEDYYSQSGISLAGTKGDFELQSDGSARAAASVRPQATAIEEVYKQGKIDGTFKEFFPNGNLKRETRYIGGQMNGLYRTYYENGQIEQEAVYVHGQIEGTYRAYYEDGKAHQEKDYANGKLNGTYKAFDEFGIPFFEISYKDNVQHGADKIFDQKGVLQFMDTYSNGVLINRKTFDEFGRLKFDQYFEENVADADKKEGEDQIRERERQEQEKRRQKRQ
jgi:hypothetical protein